MKKTPLKRGNSKLKFSPLKSSGKGLNKGSCKIKVKPKTEEQKQENQERIDRQNELFQKIWDERPHVDYETGEYIPGELKTVYMHHVLHKQDNCYPQYAFCEWNIIILTWENHNQAHTDLDKLPRVKALTEELKRKHLNGELES